SSSLTPRLLQSRRPPDRRIPQTLPKRNQLFPSSLGFTGAPGTGKSTSAALKAAAISIVRFEVIAQIHTGQKDKDEIWIWKRVQRARRTPTSTPAKSRATLVG